MILVPDTNVLVSALVYGGGARMLLAESVYRGHALVVCDQILAELADVLERPHILQARKKRGLTYLPLDELLSSCQKAVPARIDPPVCRDPDDDVILACAVAANADCIVTGDADLLVLGRFQGIEIVTVANILRRIAPVP